MPLHNKLTVSLKLARSNIQRYKHSRVDVGVANLLCVLEICKVPYKDTKTLRVDVCVTNFTV